MGTHRNPMSPATAAAKRRALLVMLEECAERGSLCPGLGALGNRLGVGSSSVSHLFCRLRDQRRIRWTLVRRPSGHNVRIVTILSTGKKTRAPESAGARIVDIELERAKTALRRLGQIVYDAEVTDGRAGRGFVKVDGRNITPADVLARAARLAAR